MRLIAKLFKKIYYLYSDSIKLLHSFILILSIILFSLLSISSPNNFNEFFLDILNGMGILTSFFILIIDKVNIKELNENLSNMRKIANGKREISTGKWVSNTLFSLTTTMFFLLGLLYILLIFNIKCEFLLIWLVSNIFISFLFALISWSFIEN